MSVRVTERLLTANETKKRQVPRSLKLSFQRREKFGNHMAMALWPYVRRLTQKYYFYEHEYVQVLVKENYLEPSIYTKISQTFTYSMSLEF